MIWAAIHTKPLQEFIARDDLCLSKYHVFLPVLSRTSIKRKKRIIISDPLFTSYLFVKINENDNLSHLEQCKGIEYVIRIPSIKDQQIIDHLKLAESAGAFDYTKPQSDFEIGETVQIQEGPFAGLIAKVQSASPRKRVRILMNLLGGIVESETEACNLQKVG